TLYINTLSLHDALPIFYCQSIDYQGLIDSHFRYLYSPSSHWAKFSRIAIFLHTVRRYISTQINIDDEIINEGPGYYHDLINISRSEEHTSELQSRFDLV